MDTKRKPENCLGIIVIVAFALNIFAIYPAFSTTTNVYVDPQNNTFYTDTTSVGDHFTVSLKVTDVTDLYAWQVKLYFNSTQIEVVDAWIPNTDPTYVFYGRTTMSTVTTGPDYVLISDIITTGPTFNGSGLLAKIAFKIIMAPPSNGTLSCDLDIDNTDTYLLDSTMTEIPTTKTNGYYEYVWSPPYRDIAIINMTAPETVIRGEVVDIAVTLENQGYLTENFTLYATFCVSLNLTLAPKTSTTIIYSFNTSDTTEGNYTLWAYVPPCFGDQDPCDNMYTDGILGVIAGIHDIAIINVTTSKDGGLPMPFVSQGYTARVNVTILNEGTFTENVAVTAYANSLVIGTQTFNNLAQSAQVTLTFVWDTAGFVKGNYTISANATAVPDETDLADNTFMDGVVYVGIPGDVNCDGKVRIDDVRAVARCFGSNRGEPKYDPNCDINDDDKIRIDDVRWTAKHFGEGP